MNETITPKVVTFSGVLGVRELRSYVDPAPGHKSTDKVFFTCSRCGGRGRIEAFAHVLAGICFKCDGTGQTPTSVSTLRRWAKVDAYARDYADEIRAEQARQDAELAAASQARELANAWDEAHAEQDRRNKLVQGFLGEVGERVTAEVTVNFAKYNEGSWNRSASMFIVATTDAGQAVKISGSSESLFSLERGDKATITATVKAHDEYRAQQQTVLFRVKATKKVDA